MDLVRSAEEEAVIAAADDEPPPEEDYVDVGDEAVEAPPSLPPLRAATPNAAFRRVGTPAKEMKVPSATVSAPAVTPAVTPRGPRPRRSEEFPPGRGLPPALGILLPIALAVLALMAVLR